MQKSLYPVRLTAEILLIIGVAQALILQTLPLWAPPNLPVWASGLLNAVVLVLLAGPLVYWRCLHGVDQWATAPAAQDAPTPAVSPAMAFVAALLAQLAVLGLTALLLAWMHHALEADAQRRFQRATERVHEEIVRRMERPLMGLMGARGAYAASQAIERAEFRAYVDARDVRVEFPGVRGYGFAQRVAPAALARFAAQQRALGAPDFAVHPASAPSASGDHWVVQYIEPIEYNAPALGYDLGQERVLREAIEQAVQAGQPVLSGKVHLIQEADLAPGLLYFLPVYHQGAPLDSARAREAALRGVLFMPIVADELFKGLDATVGGSVRVQIFEGEAGAYERSLYDSGSGAEPDPEQALHSVQLLHVGTRQLALRLYSTPLLHAQQDRTALTVAALAGLLVSALVGLAVWLLVAGRLRAQRLAERMTHDLDRLARVVQHTNNAVFITDTARRITWVNVGFTRLTGYTLAEAQGHTPDALLGHGNADASAVARLQLAVGNAQPCRVELLARTKDGRELWLDTELQPTREPGGAPAGFMEIATDVTAQKATQRRLEAAIRDTSTLLSTVEVHSIVSVADRDGNILDVNDAFCRISGYSRAELIGQNHRIVNSGVQTQAFWAAMWDTISRGASWRGDVCNRAKDGSLYWVDSMVAPFIGDDGQVERYVSIRTDITQRKRDEQRLAESEAFLERVGQVAGVGGWSVNLQTGRIHWSRQTRRIHEVDDAFEPTLQSAIAFYAPEAQPVIEAAVQAGMREGKGWDLELPFVTASGRAIWVRALGTVEFADGQPVMLSGAFQDVTERRERDQALHLLELCISRIKDSILITDARQLDAPGPRIVFANHAFETLTGYTQQEILGCTPRMLQGPDTDRPALDRIRVAIGQGQSISEELLNYSKDGHPYWIEISISPVHSALGTVTHFVAVERDVTERRRADAALRDALERAQQASVSKSQFLANMSHEIRTPMNAILGMLKLLQNTELTERQLDYAQKTEGAARSLLGLLNDILDFSKVEAGKMTLDPRPFRIERLIRDLSVILSANVGNRNLALVFEVDPALPPALLGDDLRLQQVLINLGGNAIKFTSAGQVRVQLRLVERQEADVLVEFSVHDSGIGIAKEHLAHIFTGFSQAEASTTRRFGGTGLGLAISARLVALMGGSLAVDSTLGQGSRFYFQLRLPLAQLPTEPLPQPSPVAATGVKRARARRLAGLRLLVAEDNKINQMVAKGLLEQEGAAVTLVEDGQRCVQALQASPQGFDAVLMDVQMPVMDGYAATRAIRSALALTQLPVIAMTANAMASDRAACLEAGMNDHVGKPFELDQLVALLRTLTAST